MSNLIATLTAAVVTAPDFRGLIDAFKVALTEVEDREIREFVATGIPAITKALIVTSPGALRDRDVLKAFSRATYTVARRVETDTDRTIECMDLHRFTKHIRRTAEFS